MVIIAIVDCVCDGGWCAYSYFDFHLCVHWMDAVHFVLRSDTGHANMQHAMLFHFIHKFLFNSFISILLIFTAFQQCFNCVALVCDGREHFLKRTAAAAEDGSIGNSVTDFVLFFLFAAILQNSHTECNRTPNIT